MDRTDISVPQEHPDQSKVMDPSHLFQLPLPSKTWLGDDYAEIARRIYFCSHARPGERVKTGDHIGYFMTYSGEIDDFEIYSPVTGIVRTRLHQGVRDGAQPLNASEYEAVLEIQTEEGATLTAAHLETAYGKIAGPGQMAAQLGGTVFFGCISIVFCLLFWAGIILLGITIYENIFG